MPLPQVSVIIPVFDDHERLAACLRALENQTYPPGSYEVVVVDNNSSESVLPLVTGFQHARAHQESRPGSYAARNRGLSVATGEVIAFTDADCVPSPDWIEKGVASLSGTEGCGLVAGRVEIYPRDPKRLTAVELYESRTGLRQRDYVERGGFGATANLFTRRNVFEQVGQFDASLKSGGDLEWGQRVCAAGYRLVYTDDAVVAHPARRSLGQLRRRVSRVIGGFHTLNQEKRASYTGLGRGFLVDALPPVRASVAALLDPQLPGATNKLKVIAVLFFVQYVQVFERLRLSFGGSAQR